MISEEQITSIIITVYSETFSVEQTIERLIKKDRGYILEIILLVHPNSSRQSKIICQKLFEQYKIVKIQYIVETLCLEIWRLEREPFRREQRPSPIPNFHKLCRRRFAFAGDG